MSDPLISSIDSTLKDYPLCRQIIRFLIKNKSAMDTTKGIASCWVGADEAAVQSALDRLSLCGAITAHTLRSGTLYGLTQDQGIRAWLDKAVRVEAQQKQVAQGNSSPIG